MNGNVLKRLVLATLLLIPPALPGVAFGATYGTTYDSGGLVFGGGNSQSE